MELLWISGDEAIRVSMLYFWVRLKDKKKPLLPVQTKGTTFYE